MEARVYPASNEIWVHTRTGNEYSIIVTANLGAEHTDSKFPVIISYMGKDGRVWARRAGEFFHKFHKLVIGIA